MSRLTSFLFVVVLASALIAWLATVATTLSLHQSDNAGNGMSYSFAGIGVIVTWVMLAVLLLMSFGRISTPVWVPLAAFAGFVASAGAGIIVVNLLRDNNGNFSAQWPIVSLIVAPLLMIAFAVWASFPPVQRLVEPQTVFIGVWVTVLVLSVIPFPLRSAQKRALAIQRETYMANAAARRIEEQEAPRRQLATLTDSSHLREFLALASNSTEMREAVLARARSLPNRQKDVVEMLNKGEGAAMGELRNLDLEISPELCTGGVEFLRKHAVEYLGKQNFNSNRFVIAAQELDKYMFGLQWMAERHCDVRPAIIAYRETAMGYPAAPEREQFVKRLEDFAQLSGNPLDAK